jgi:hypothetical protein
MMDCSAVSVESSVSEVFWGFVVAERRQEWFVYVEVQLAAASRKQRAKEKSEVLASQPSFNLEISSFYFSLHNVSAKQHAARDGLLAHLH